MALLATLDLEYANVDRLGQATAEVSRSTRTTTYSGFGPVTRVPGRSISITHRKVQNHRLCAAGFVWAFMAITNHPPARAHYDRRRKHGGRHAAALRNPFSWRFRRSFSTVNMLNRRSHQSNGPFDVHGAARLGRTAGQVVRPVLLDACDAVVQLASIGSTRAVGESGSTV
jgi:hypothetical protein